MNRWLKSARLKVETEELIVAAKDKSLATSHYQVKTI